MCKEIVGTWTLDPDDIESQQIYGNTSMEFTEAGDLIYTIHLEGKDQKIFMTYKVEQQLLITSQSSSPRKEKTKFRLLSNGKLELYFEDVKSTYTKVN
jgi:hypothetical protein